MGPVHCSMTRSIDDVDRKTRQLYTRCLLVRLALSIDHLVSPIACNEPRAAPVGEIRPEPIENDDGPVPSADQKGDMSCAPKPPRGLPPYAKLADLGNGRLTPDRGKTAKMPVAKRGRWAPPRQTRRDHASHIPALLFGRRRETRNNCAAPSQTGRGIADRIDPLQSRHGQISGDGKPS